MVFRKRIERFVTIKLLALLVLTLTVAGCGVRPGDYPVSSNCQWREEASRSLNLENYAGRKHLRQDAITAEDVAIRWADRYAGLGSNDFRGMPEYRKRRDECMEAMFQGIANVHAVDVAMVRDYRLNRDIVADSAVIAGFVLLYAVVAYCLASWIHRRLSPNGWVGFLIVVVAMSLAGSIIGVLVGDFWSLFIENLRMNSGHLSYRVDRVPWRQHWGLTIFGCLLVFWSMALIRALMPSREQIRLTILGL